ncbi:hypothetical protein [Saccharothrix algeriensis]|uniref:Uncharacterized protein n=1 Tax=Saccharothrix algeriensis TaxID=173560 RepID=A0ABS2S2L4_9PSEU|nr:hypothetical protein [Saccharothrix algeriensis]MBM7810180.1 hypothetical protein [Saccharothrix algeriensis]
MTHSANHRAGKSHQEIEQGVVGINSENPSRTGPAERSSHGRVAV